jgi:phospholipase/lecithinase/hemolysin
MHLLDMAKLTDDIVTDPVFRASVGFEYSAGASCDKSLFADVLHPSGYAHTLIAKAALEELGIPEPASILLVLLALMSLTLVVRRKAIYQQGE